jgi:hypothetical protein
LPATFPHGVPRKLIRWWRYVMNEPATSDAHSTIREAAREPTPCLPADLNAGVDQVSSQTLNVRIRTARPHDAGRIAELAAQLGYAVTPDDMRSRLERVRGNEDHLVIVAENQDNEIIGWLHLTVTRPLLSEPAHQHCRAGRGRAQPPQRSRSRLNARSRSMDHCTRLEVNLTAHQGPP